MTMPQMRDLNPLRLLQTNFSYQRVPNASHSDSSLGLDGSLSDGSPTRPQWAAPHRRLRASLTKLICGGILAIVILSLMIASGAHIRRKHTAQQQQPAADPEPAPGYFWIRYSQLHAYFNGIRTLVPPEQHQPENRYNMSYPPEGLTAEEIAALPKEPPLDPFLFNPYPDYESSEYLASHAPVQTCYLDAEETVKTPDVYAYPGVPRNIADPFWGSYKELGFRDDICFERFGRLGPYGFGYNESMHGLGPGQHVEHAGSEKVFEKTGYVDYNNISWGEVQKRCSEKNKERFQEDQPQGKTRVPKHAYILRVWTGYTWRPAQILTIRAMINELSLKSGGEYDVHLLLHVRDDGLPIWADSELYRKTLEENIPQEFWNITTLWSQQQMRMYYPLPFGFDSFNFGDMVVDNLHNVYRTPHFALQWFAQKNPQYDFYWNWEMDMRYTGHYYDFHDKVARWAKKQPRKGLWERSARFWFPKHHGDFATNFTDFVERETREVETPNNDEATHGPSPVWGPLPAFASPAPPQDRLPPTSYDEDAYNWGVGEEADLITFNPIFDPSTTNWVLRKDVTGYPPDQHIPPRRVAIVTVARLSKRLLQTMHHETWANRHTMFPEMWPATACLHHGFKAVYAPHPVFFDRDWELENMVRAFNHPGAPHESPFGWGEHMMLGSTFYYNSRFSAKLWRRWLGLVEDGEGGRQFEEEGTGRMCLRPILHHPIKREDGLEELADA